MKNRAEAIICMQKLRQLNIDGKFLIVNWSPGKEAEEKIKEYWFEEKRVYDIPVSTFSSSSVQPEVRSQRGCMAQTSLSDQVHSQDQDGYEQDKSQDRPDERQILSPLDHDKDLPELVQDPPEQVEEFPDSDYNDQSQDLPFQSRPSPGPSR
ncbi:uncharacterized protein LOC144431267 [Styela clava]